MTPIGPLVLSTVQVRAGDFTILHDVTVKLHPGELCGLIGPSGAGKSTLIKVLLGLRKPSQGKASLGGGPVDAVAIGYVPQDDALHRSLTVAESLGFSAELRLPELSRAQRKERIEQVIEQVDLSERLGVKIKKLSGGQRKRVSVALELLTQPPILILDEPTSGLDPGLEAKMMELFEGLAQSGRIVLVATHAMQSLLRCQALCVLVKGRVAYFAEPQDAPAHFGAGTFAGIFEKLNAHDAVHWGKAWNGQPQRPAFLGRPAPEPRSSSTRSATTSASARAPARELPKITEAPPEAPKPLTAEEQLAALKARMGKK
ncbi:MAG: ABC transporter ATP-binding protein [Proteobacteria bacterium]|nr:ABC transporter ATP-binding protein [Pseudomonadota bacterium]MCP4918425.1 ABC transporter ATP-binding protein [Pseudomonadota bacterium]